MNYLQKFFTESFICAFYKNDLDLMGVDYKDEHEGHIPPYPFNRNISTCKRFYDDYKRLCEYYKIEPLTSTHLGRFVSTFTTSIRHNNKNFYKFSTPKFKQWVESCPRIIQDYSTSIVPALNV